MSVIEIKNLSKSYGTLKAVDDFSLAAEKGEILAVVGPDGAGKTSTFRAICGLITYDSGEMKIAGYNVDTQFRQNQAALGIYAAEFFALPRFIGRGKSLILRWSVRDQAEGSMT